MDEQRRLAFGSVAEAYDRARPSYPDALVDDVLRLAGGAPLRAVEVGAGTGKATRLFAARGTEITALEPSAEMADVGAKNLGDVPSVRFLVTEFEPWPRTGAPYDLVFSAQAWHWIDPERRAALAAACLRPGGVLAAFWNRPDWARCALREEIDAAYAEHAPQLLSASPLRPASTDVDGMRPAWESEIARTPGLAEPEIRSYPWDIAYTAAGYCDLVGTHSDHVLLEPAARTALLAQIAAVIDAAGGSMLLPQLTHLCLARAAG